MADPDFKVGDIVRLKSGNAPQEVIHVHKKTLSTIYLSARRSSWEYEPSRPRRKQDFVLINSAIKPIPEEEPIMLFKTQDDRYGTKIATDSLGRIVLEIRGEKPSVEAFAPDEIEEVVPYTVQIDDGHYEVPKGSLKKGDILLIQGFMGTVKGVDTKSRSAKKLPAGTRRVVTEEIG